MEKYGIGYQGSKSRIISKLSKYFPSAENFYDLFGGGFSVTHYLLENRKNSYKHFYFNEIRPGVCELIKDAIGGKYNYEVFKPEWISRERFYKEKESNAYIKLCWSFGNNGKSYIFGKEIEAQKRSMHQAVVFDQFDSFMDETFRLKQWPNNKMTITDKRLYLRKVIRSLKGERIGLQQLEQLQQLSFSNLDYRKVEIKNNSLVYCDIPYQNTAEYDEEFNHKEFFNWAHDQVEPVFISEYEIKDKRFYLVKEIKKRSTFSAIKNNSTTLERLYCNEVAYQRIKYILK